MEELKLEILNGEARVINEEGVVVGHPNIESFVKNISNISRDLLTRNYYNESNDMTIIDPAKESVRQAIVVCLYRILERKFVCDFYKTNPCRERLIRTSDILPKNIGIEDITIVTTSSSFKGNLSIDGYAFLVVDNKDNTYTSMQLTDSKDVVSKWRNFDIFATEEEKEYFYKELIRVLTAKDTVRVTNKFLPGMNTYQINSVDISGEIELYEGNLLNLLLDLVQS